MIVKILKITVLILVSLIVSCTNSVDPDCDIYRNGIIEVDIPDTVKVNQEYEIEVAYGAPNLCYQFKELTTEFSNNNLTISAAICDNSNSDEDCPQSPLYGEETTTVVFKTEGGYSVFINDDSFYKTVWVE